MMKIWLTVGATLLVCILLSGCYTGQNQSDITEVETQLQILELEDSLLKAQDDLNKAQNDLTNAQNDLNKLRDSSTKENQINTFESDLTALQSRYVQVLDVSNSLISQVQYLENQLESQLESHLSAYAVLEEKVVQAKIYAEIIDKYILVPYYALNYTLTAQERNDLDHLVHLTNNVELKEKWAVFYFSGKEVDAIDFNIAVGDELWEILR